MQGFWTSSIVGFSVQRSNQIRDIGLLLANTPDGDYGFAMSDKQRVIEAIERLPKSASLDQIRDCLDFLTAVLHAQNSLRLGKGIPLSKVREQFSSWVNEWTSKSSGRQKRSTTSNHRPLSLLLTFRALGNPMAWL
ncbi:MAG: hypothetical protein ACTHLW_15640 [Verrucomicrobiota bacterium]